MRVIYLYLLLILIWFFYKLYKDSKYNNQKEEFMPLEEKKYPLAYQQRPYQDLEYTKNLDKPMPDSVCCKISRKLDTGNGEWFYDHEKLKGEACKPYNENYPEINKVEYYYLGNNNWDTMDKCSNKYVTNKKQPFLGSCRNLNFECLDFIDKGTCDKYSGYTWSHKTCMENIDFPITYKEYDHYLLNE